MVEVNVNTGTDALEAVLLAPILAAYLLHYLLQNVQAI